jgi:hypothetical protein
MSPEKIDRFKQYVCVLALALVVLLVALFLNRPVKVSILENVFIEVGEGQAGPPEFYEKAVVLEDGRTVYLSNGGCKVKE